MYFNVSKSLQVLCEFTLCIPLQCSPLQVMDKHMIFVFCLQLKGINKDKAENILVEWDFNKALKCLHSVFNILGLKKYQSHHLVSNSQVTVNRSVQCVATSCFPHLQFILAMVPQGPFLNKWLKPKRLLRIGIFKNRVEWNLLSCHKCLFFCALYGCLADVLSCDPWPSNGLLSSQWLSVVW